MNKLNRQKGQALVLAIVVVGMVLINTLVIISGSQIFSQNTNYTLQASQAVNLAEAGIDKAVASLNVTAGSYNGEVETPLGPGSYSVTVTSKDASTNIVTATGYVPNKTNPKAKRTIQIETSKGTGISFIYGMLSGNGGIAMGNGSTINGSVYSNGNITGGNNSLVTGDVYVAGGTQPSPDQQTDCVSPSCSDYIFGKTVAVQDRLDVAQSFRPSTTGVLNKVSFKLKKVSLPANPTVKIMADNNGAPNKSSVLASGTLLADRVAEQYPVGSGFIDVTFSSSPNLTAGTLYWIMIAAQTLDSSNYWVWSEDTLQSYTRGFPAWSSDWQAKKNPVWTAIAGDLGFQTWMGGVVTSIEMGNGSRVNGSVHANTIEGITIGKDAYYQTISGSTVNGASYPGSSDPPPVAMPISAANISDWQAGAERSGVTTGDITGCPASLGPGKIVGNVTTGSNCTITVTTPIWITGNLTFGNSAIFKMNPSQGASSGVIIVDGTTVFANSDNLLGTGANGSYLTLLSTYDSQARGGQAISTGNSSITGILYAPFGVIALANNANFKEAVGWKLTMGNGTILTYDSGLISTFFSAGPSGSFSVIKGTYQLK